MPDEDGNTALHYLAMRHNMRESPEEEQVQYMEILIEEGAGVDRQNNRRRTSAHFALESERLHLLKCLCEAEADFEITDENDACVFDPSDNTREDIKAFLEGAWAAC